MGNNSLIQKVKNKQRMAFKHNDAFLSLVFLLLFIVCSKAYEPPPHHIGLLKRSSFSKDFIFGSASSAYQVKKTYFISTLTLFQWHL